MIPKSIKKTIIKFSLIVIAIILAVGVFGVDMSVAKTYSFQSIMVNAAPDATTGGGVTGTSGGPISPCDTNIGIGCVQFLPIKDYKNSSKPGENIIRFTLRIANILTYLAGAFAVLVIVLSSYKMFGANGDKAKYEAGLNNVLYACVGLILAIVSYTIVAVLSTFVASPDLIGFVIPNLS
jgi:Type IV secretion system pilin